MNKLFKSICIVGACVGIGYAAYEYLLDDRAKKSLSKTIESVKENYTFVSNYVSESSQPKNFKVETYKNQMETRNDWSRLGY